METVELRTAVHLVCVCGLFPMLVACAGEPQRLEPRVPPARVLPAVSMPAQPLAARYGRVVLDATDGPMRVAAKYDPSFVPPGGPVERGRSGELCVTPCVVDLPVGKYRLFLSATEGSNPAAGDSDDLLVGEGVQIYRRAPGSYRTPSPYDVIGPAAVIIVSMVGLTAGGIMLANEDTRAVGAGLFIGGAVGGTLGGIWGYNAGRATQQDGATSTWQHTP